MAATSTPAMPSASSNGSAVHSVPAMLEIPRDPHLPHVADGDLLARLLPPSSVDQARLMEVGRELLVALGEGSDSEHLRDTPRRFAAALVELLTPVRFNPTTFPNDAGYTGLVLIEAIPFSSLCQHHLLPFSGVAHVGYVPADRILGLSKFARVVEFFARRLQVQERLTKQVADWIQEHLEPRGVGVVMEAAHSCMWLRGVRATGSRTVTTTFLGALQDNPSLQAELWSRSRRPQ